MSLVPLLKSASCVCISVLVCACGCEWPWTSEEGTRTPGAGATVLYSLSHHPATCHLTLIRYQDLQWVKGWPDIQRILQLDVHVKDRSQSSECLHQISLDSLQETTMTRARQSGPVEDGEASSEGEGLGRVPGRSPEMAPDALHTAVCHSSLFVVIWVSAVLEHTV